MTTYCTVYDVRSRLAGFVPNMGPEWDGILAAKCSEASADIDRRIRQVRSQPNSWSFLADTPNAVQQVLLSGTPTAGTFTLARGVTTSGSIAYNAVASAVATALNTAFGAGTVAVTGVPGNWTVTFLAAGPQPFLAGVASLTPATSYVVVQDIRTGVLTVPSVRRFTGRRGGTDLLPIDDCVSVSSVQILDAQGNVVQTLAAGTDYLPDPIQGTPITGLTLVRRGWWPWNAGGIAVGATWGYGTDLLPDVRETACIEVIRSFNSDKTGNSDALGVTPFGTAQMSRAFSSKLNTLIQDYRSGSAFFRG